MFNSQSIHHKPSELSITLIHVHIYVGDFARNIGFGISGRVAPARSNGVKVAGWLWCVHPEHDAWVLVAAAVGALVLVNIWGAVRFSSIASATRAFVVSYWK